MFILKVRWEVARSGAQPLAPSGNGLLGFFGGLGGWGEFGAIKNRSNV